MAERKTVLITGAAGNLGAKLSHHWQGRYDLRLLDSSANPAIISADLSRWDLGWVEHFRGVDTVVHLAAQATAHESWGNLIGANIDAVIHVFQAAALMKVRRVIYASSNHVMGGYKDLLEPWRLTTNLPPLPGARYVVNGEQRDSTAYGAAKLFGERLGKCYSEIHGISVIAVRIGWVRPGENRPEDIPPERGPWFQLMWLSNRDFCQLMTRCAESPLGGFVVLNGMSANTGMRWDIDSTRKLVGYEPQDDVTLAGIRSRP
jgi:NAD+ dependent glucose-6-phosphate dehydrogenase